MSNEVQATAPLRLLSQLTAPQRMQGRARPSDLHQSRLEAVLAILRKHGARRVADLGSGPGALFERLADDPGVERLVAVDLGLADLLDLKQRVGDAGGRAAYVHGSFTDPGLDLGGCDAAVLLETIEHIDPEHLSRVERSVFGAYRPRLVVITTPNAEYNPLLGVPAGRRRHWDHRFEWDRARFARWCEGVALRCGFQVVLSDAGPRHAAFGAPTQIAEFVRRA